MRPINLLPPEAAQRSFRRRRLLGYMLLGVAYIALLALVTVWWNGKAADAEGELEAQIQRNEQLRAELAGLQDAADLRSRYEDGVRNVETALATDVAWGRLLNDLGRVIPDRVWLTSFDGIVEPSDEDPAALGQVSLAGRAFDYPDAASWLRVLDSDIWPAVGGAWVTAATASEIGDTELSIIDFDSVASLTKAALSDRAEQRIPEVP